MQGQGPVQVTIYRRPQIGRDGDLDQSEAYDISQVISYKLRFVTCTRIQAQGLILQRIRTYPNFHFHHKKVRINPNFSNENERNKSED